MNPSDTRPEPPDRDLCDELLAPPTTPSDLAPLRERVVRRTTRLLRRRRNPSRPMTSGCSWPSKTPARRRNVMRKLWNNLLAPALLLAAVTAASAQEKPKSEPKPDPKPTPAKSKLEQMLELALKNNPDL